MKKPVLSENARRLLKERFLLEREDGSKETPEDMMRRVARTLATQERHDERSDWEAAFFDALSGLLFHPGSRVMANAGTRNQQLANCYVLPLEDDRHAILKTFSEACDIKGNGGGCGFNYSKVRPRGDMVRDHKDLACGPTALLKLFDVASSIFRQKGRYESGNMAILNVDHPDILEFVSAKEADGTLRLTNISVGITDAFMHAVMADGSWDLLHPRSRQIVKTTSARALFKSFCEIAWRTGDPGLIFLDRINQDNVLLDSVGPIDATNTCGEIGLFPYESCNLGYINLVKILKENGHGQETPFDLPLLRTVVHLAIRMIDDAISCSWFPVEAIDESVKNNRRIGLGVTGWADCLSIAGIPYDSEEALNLADELIGSIRQFAEEATRQLASERGPYPNSCLSGELHKRNIALLALPPSGNNAIIFDTSFSIEPHFSLSYVERVMGDQILYHKNKHLQAALAAVGLNQEEIFATIADSNGSIQGIHTIPVQIRRAFRTAHDIAPDAHVKMQAAFQKHVDNAVTKTVNLPRSSVPSDVAKIYREAWALRCKGITIYRDGTRGEQAIEFGNESRHRDIEHVACEECVIRSEQIG